MLNLRAHANSKARIQYGCIRVINGAKQAGPPVYGGKASENRWVLRRPTILHAPGPHLGQSFSINPMYFCFNLYLYLCRVSMFLPLGYPNITIMSVSEYGKFSFTGLKVMHMNITIYRIFLKRWDSDDGYHTISSFLNSPLLLFSEMGRKKHFYFYFPLLFCRPNFGE